MLRTLWNSCEAWSLCPCVKYSTVIVQFITTYLCVCNYVAIVIRIQTSPVNNFDPTIRIVPEVLN